MGFGCCQPLSLASQCLPAKPGDIRDSGSILESGRSLEESMATHASMLAMNRGAWGYSPQAHKESDMTEAT